VGIGSGEALSASADVARRFGPDNATGIRLNAAVRDGGTAVDREEAKLGLASVGLDWRSRDLRLSGDLGWQDNRLKKTRTNVTLGAAAGIVPTPPADSTSNWAQDWTYSNEKDLFGTFRAEYDISKSLTAWGAYGLRRSEEANSLANLTVTNGATGAGTMQRFDNTREDDIDTGEVGLRGKLRTGSVGHELVASAGFFKNSRNNAFAGFDAANTMATNLYTPSYYPQPPFSAGAFVGNNLASPALQARITLQSIALGDTLSMLDDRLLLTLGARDQNIKVENWAYTTNIPAPVYDDSRVSPALAAVFKATKQFSVYGNYIEGLQQGDAAPSTALNFGVMLAPYVSKQTEVGLKYDGGRFGAGAAYFSTDKPRGIVEGGVFQASGEDRHQGVEVTLFGQPMSGLRLLGGVTWLDAVQKKTGSATTDGKRVIGVPEFQASLGADWDIPGTSFTLDGRVIYTGSSFVNATNTLEAPDWTRFDIGLRYYTTVARKEVALRARIDNVTDKSYWASSGGFPGSGYLVMGMPRTFTLSASVDF
jgi:iron complex outermembrane recepter protein